MAKTEKIEFRISVNDFDKGLGDELKKANAAVSVAENNILEAFAKSDRFKALRDIAGVGSMGSKNSFYPRIYAGQIQADIVVDVAGAEGTATPYFNIPEKTANLLLTGKLLTDDQKKALIKRMGFDLDSLDK